MYCVQLSLVLPAVQLRDVGSCSAAKRTRPPSGSSEEVGGPAGPESLSSPAQVGAMVIAYEPIWAIGTGRTASAEDAQAVCSLVRTTVAQVAGSEAAASVRVQYGGSVKAGNAKELMAQPDIDGALVGGASLDADEFARIVRGEA